MPCRSRDRQGIFAIAEPNLIRAGATMLGRASYPSAPPAKAAMCASQLSVPSSASVPADPVGAAACGHINRNGIVAIAQEAD